MPIAIECASCRQTLELPDEHAGAQAQCPACGAVFTAPSAWEAPLSEEEAWHLKTPEGRVYGPVSKAQLDRWLDEGRIAEDCHLRQGERAPWRLAEETYPDLRPIAAEVIEAPVVRAAPVAPPPTPLISSPDVSYTAHRGPLVLVLGILGLVTLFPLFSIFAWTMGAADLEEMRKGRMDPGGRPTTNAGYLLGMLMALAWIVGLVIAMFAILFFGVFV